MLVCKSGPLVRIGATRTLFETAKKATKNNRNQNLNKVLVLSNPYNPLINRVIVVNGAGNEVRTRDPNLGKVVKNITI